MACTYGLWTCCCSEGSLEASHSGLMQAQVLHFELCLSPGLNGIKLKNDVNTTLIGQTVRGQRDRQTCCEIPLIAIVPHMRSHTRDDQSIDRMMDGRTSIQTDRQTSFLFNLSRAFCPWQTQCDAQTDNTKGLHVNTQTHAARDPWCSHGAGQAPPHPYRLPRWCRARPSGSDSAVGTCSASHSLSPLWPVRAALIF